MVFRAGSATHRAHHLRSRAKPPQIRPLSEFAWIRRTVLFAPPGSPCPVNGRRPDVAVGRNTTKINTQRHEWLAVWSRSPEAAELRRWSNHGRPSTPVWTPLGSGCAKTSHGGRRPNRSLGEEECKGSCRVGAVAWCPQTAPISRQRPSATEPVRRAWAAIAPRSVGDRAGQSGPHLTTHGLGNRRIPPTCAPQGVTSQHKFGRSRLQSTRINTSLFPR